LEGNKKNRNPISSLWILHIPAAGQNLGIIFGPVLFGKVVEMSSWVNAGYMLVPFAVSGVITAWMVKVR